MAKDRSFSPLFILVALVTAVAALYFAKAILLPLALSILLCFLLAPLCDRLERWRVPRLAAVIVVVAMSVAVLGGLGYIVTNQLVDLGLQLPVHKENLIKKIQSIRPSDSFSEVSQTISELRKELVQGDKGKKSAADANGKTATDAAKSADVTQAPLPPPAIRRPFETSYETFFKQVQNWLGSLVAPIATAGIVIVLVFFMLLDRESQRTRLVQLFGRSHMHTTTEAIHDVSMRVGRYLRMLFVVNATYGMAVALGLGFIGVPGALMWGVLAFALRFLPYLGPWIAAVLPIMVSIATADGWTQPMLVVGWYVIVELISNNVIEPWLYGSSVGISTVGVIVTAILWTWLWGPIGLILAMPMTVCLIVSARYVPQLRFITILLADQPPLSPPERVYQRLLAYDYHEPLKLAKKHIKESSLASFYDDVLVPALRMAEQDRHEDVLSTEQATFVMEAADDLVEELGEAKLSADGADKAVVPAKAPVTVGSSAAGNSAPAARILCVPLRDEADEAASRMLAQLLAAEGFDVDTEDTKSLTSEVVNRVADMDSEVVVISIVPPIGPRESRLLWKRLRSRFPDLPIIVGYWTGSSRKDELPSPEDGSASKVATTLSEAVTLVRSVAAQRNLSAKTA
jgi:predicted PurR-regulated permease PerM